MAIDSIQLSEGALPKNTSVAAVRLDGVSKRFGDVVAVAGIDLEIADGEFFSMLGPSIPVNLAQRISSEAGGGGRY